MMPTISGYVDSEWGQVHYRRAGDQGPWVALFHESPLSSQVFERVLPLLGGTVRAVAFDTPGYGGSAPPPSNGFEIPDYARVLAGAAEALGMSSPVLAGVHTGASIALEVASILTTGSSGLVLSGIPLYSEEERQYYVSEWTPKPPVDSKGSQFAWAVERYRRIWGEDVPADMLHLAVVNVMRVADRYDWAYQAAFRHDPSSPLTATTLPVLLLNAEFDLLAYKDPLAQTLARHAELMVLPDVRGQVHLRAPDVYAREVLRFIDQVSGPVRRGAAT